MKLLVIALLSLAPALSLAQVTSRCEVPRHIFTGEMVFGGGYLVSPEIVNGKNTYSLTRTTATLNGQNEALGSFEQIDENYTQKVFQIKNTSFYLYVTKDKPEEVFLIDASTALLVKCSVMLVKVVPFGG